MPNIFAYAMLLSWPVFTALLFRRFPPGQAVIWTIVGGYLLLPPVARFDLPLLPDLDKYNIANICAFVGFVATRRQPWGLPSSVFARLAMALFLLTPIGMVITNLDYIPLAQSSLPPLVLQEIPTIMLSKMFVMLPFLVGYNLLRDENSARDILIALVFAGLMYSIPMLIEVAIGPEINVVVYGFLQHSYEQTMRYGGFRPLVFLPHGLWMALFAFMAAFSAAAMLRAQTTELKKNIAIFLYLVMLLVLCKSAGAIIYMLFLAPFILFAPPKLAIFLAAVAAAVVQLYPLLRGADLIPTAAITDIVGLIDPDRAVSLIFRLNNEDVLLDRAAERPWFGWGGWGRNLLFDPVSGGLLTVTDGRWIITIGEQGWFGYFGEFGLLVLPLFMLMHRLSRTKDDISRHVAALSLLLAINMIDLVPNATLVPLTWLFAGSLLGYAEAFHGSNTEVTAPKRLGLSAPWARPGSILGRKTGANQSD